MLQKISAVGMAAAGVLALAGVASATTVNVGFARVEPHNSSQNPAAQFNCAVSDVVGHSNQVTFTFTNNVGITSSISEIYYDDRNPLQLLTLNEPLIQQGCSFAGGSANPGNLPGGNNLSPPFQAIMGFSADAVGNPSVGIDTPTDFLTMNFTLQSGASFATVVSALNSGSLRVGVHVRNIGTNGQSDSFVNSNVSTVPLPIAAWTGGAALLGLAGLRRRRDR
jgi:hypothetical protein